MEKLTSITYPTPPHLRHISSQRQKNIWIWNRQLINNNCLSWIICIIQEKILCAIKHIRHVGDEAVKVCPSSLWPIQGSPALLLQKSLSINWTWQQSSWISKKKCRVIARSQHCQSFKAKKHIFKKIGQPRPLFHFYFRLFKHTLQSLTTHKCEKWPSSIWRRDSTSWPMEHESPPITTRSGLPPEKHIFLFNPLGRMLCELLVSFISQVA